MDVQLVLRFSYAHSSEQWAAYDTKSKEKENQKKAERAQGLPCLNQSVNDDLNLRRFLYQTHDSSHSQGPEYGSCLSQAFEEACCFEDEENVSHKNDREIVQVPPALEVFASEGVDLYDGFDGEDDVESHVEAIDHRFFCVPNRQTNSHLDRQNDWKHIWRKEEF